MEGCHARAETHEKQRTPFVGLWAKKKTMYIMQAKVQQNLFQ